MIRACSTTVLYFYYLDAIAHIDYTCGLYAYNYMSPKNVMSGEYPPLADR